MFKHVSKLLPEAYSIEEISFRSKNEDIERLIDRLVISGAEARKLVPHVGCVALLKPQVPFITYFGTYGVEDSLKFTGIFLEGWLEGVLFYDKRNDKVIKSISRGYAETVEADIEE